MKSILKFLSIVFLASVLTLTYGCGKGGDEPGPGPDPEDKLVTEVETPEKTTPRPLKVDEEASIKAKGAQLTDVILLEDLKKNVYECEVTRVNETNFYFHVSESIPTGSQMMTYTLKRGEKTQTLFSQMTVVQYNYNAPDKAGYSLRGMVYCEKKGVKDVLVTDGVQIVKTDENGYYYIDSKKPYGVVYLILPKGYEVKVKNALPQFWATVDSSDPDSHQNKSFELIRNTTNTKHTAIYVADIHLRNALLQPLDLEQFKQGWIKEMMETYAGQKNIHVFNLGDFAWDAYWYSNNFGDERNLASASAQVSTIPATYWSCMGNHDNNGHTNYANYTTGSYDYTEKIAYSSDFNSPYWKKDLYASEPFRKILGPTHIAMNIGDMHYILLDDIIYENNYPGKNKEDGDRKMGMRKYHAGFRPDMLEWVKEDLKYVSKSTPITVGFHIPLGDSSGSNYNGEFNNGGIGASVNVAKLLDLFEGYQHVDFISGHTHVNRFHTLPGRGTNMYEHNIGAISGIWWACSEYCGGTDSTPGALNMCSDGVPTGYYVFENNGTSRNWYYKPIGVAKNKQFKTYDMNRVKVAYQTYAKNFITVCECDDTSGDAEEGAKIKWTPEQYGCEEPDNTIWINVWGWEKGDFVGKGPWTISVKESGKDLKVESIPYHHDPLSAWLKEVPVFENEGKGFSSSSMSRSYVPHLFRAVASDPKSTLVITVTDRFGNAYREEMKRPKDFHNGSSVIWSLD